MTDDTDRIIIIGAGAAGLGAARRLKDRRRDAIVLEARDRLGGRATTRYDLGPYPVELGAEFIHGEHVVTWELLRRFGMDALPESDAMERYGYAGGALRRRAELEAQPNDSRKLMGRVEQLARDWVAAGHPDASFAEAARRTPGFFDEPPSEDAWALWNRSVAGLYAADAEDLSIAMMLEETYAGDGHVNFRLRDGYAALWRRLAADLDVRLNTPVSRVAWGADGVTVEAGGQRFEGAAVTVTLPLGVLQAGDVVFDPPLPEEKLGAINGLGAGHVDKIVLAFSERFWPDDLAFLGTTLPSGLWWVPGFGFGPPGAVITAFFGGRAAERFEALGADAARAGVADLETIFGRTLADWVEAAQFVAWGTDPWAKMGYSYTPPGGVGRRAALAAPLAGRLFFAGEATNTTRPATVHGALESGYRAAEEALG